MSTSKLPIFIIDSSITGDMDFEYFNQLIKIKLSLNVNEVQYIFETIITPNQIFIKSLLPFEGIENTEIVKKWYQKKFLFNGNIINPIGFKTLETLTSQSILLFEHFKNKENWYDELSDFKYANKNCFNNSIKILKDIKK